MCNADCWHQILCLQRTSVVGKMTVMYAALLGALVTTGLAFGHVDTLAGALFGYNCAWVVYISKSKVCMLLQTCLHKCMSP